MKKLTKNESGLGTVLIVVVAVVIVAAIGVVAWRVDKKSPTSNNASTNTSSNSSANTAAASACIKTYNDSALCDFAEHADLATEAYVATGTASEGSGVHATFTEENDGKGNTSVSYISGGDHLSSISLAGNTYVQSSPGATWIEYSSGSSGASTVPNPTSGFNLSLESTAADKNITVVKDGTVECGKLTCYKYQIKDATEPTTTQYVFFDNSSYLLREWTSNDPTTGDTIDVTLSYQPISITKPSPVEPFSSSL